MAILSKEVVEHVDSTVVGESILISGKLEGDEDLTVRGRVHGAITLTKTLIVEPSGVVKADATVRNAVISGVVVGNITASESVHLTAEGRMVGDIASPRVIIVEGAAFRGRIDMGEVAEPKLEERPARPVQAPAPAPTPVRTAPAAPARPSSFPPARPVSSIPARPTPPPAPSRPVPPSMPARPPAPPPPPPRPVASRPVEVEPVRPPAPPAPPPPPAAPAPAPAPVAAASASSTESDEAPSASGLAKRKVVVKRKK